MKTAILTGFERYGNYVCNPTEQLARFLDGKELSGYLIHSLVLPTGPLLNNRATSYGKVILGEAARFDASAIISLGMSSTVTGIRLESTSINWVDHEKYCSQSENQRCLLDLDPAWDQRYVRLSKWNMEKMFEGFSKEKIPFEKNISSEPGYFCCNALMYRVLRIMDVHGVETPFIMAHVPCTEECISGVQDFERQGKVFVTQEQLVKAVEIILQSYKNERKDEK